MRQFRSVVAPWRAVTLAVALAALAMPAAEATVTERPAKGRYIVLFDDARADARAIAERQARKFGFAVTDLFDKGLRGYVGAMSDKAAKALAQVPGVLAVAPDGVMSADAVPPETTQNLSDHPAYSGLPAIWGLDRIDQTARPTNGTYRYNMTASDVTAYVLDTGVKSTHVEFAGGRVRAAGGYDGYRTGTDPEYGEDCEGHGTHVAGILGGKTFGVAKQAKIVSVRVLDCTGNGLASTIVKGIDWMTNDHQPGVPAVANLSFGGGANAAIDAAVKQAIGDGITVAVAAGNGGILGSGQDACASSPARLPEAITVGATDANDKKPSWSNYGPCVDVFAPGANIVSAGAASDSAWLQQSGTSMAAPHAAGVAALLLSADSDATPSEIAQALTGVATPGVVTGSKTTNPKLLYAPWNLESGVLPTAGAPAPAPAPGPAPAPTPAPCSGFLGCLLG